MGILFFNGYTVTVITVKWITLVLYIWIIVALLNAQTLQSQFRSAFYLLYICQLFAEICHFLLIELIFRPVLSNYLFTFREDMKILAEVTYFLILYLPSVVALGHVLVAANRYTAFKYPTRYNSVWTPRFVFVMMCAVWMVAAAFLLPFWFGYKHEVAFVSNGWGGVFIMGGHLFDVNLYSYLGTALLVCSSCTYFYGYAVYKADGRKNMDVRLLIWAIISSLPILVEVIRYSLLYFSPILEAPYLSLFALEAWLYTDAFNFLLQVIVPLALNKSLRNLVFKFDKKKQTVFSTAVKSPAGRSQTRSHISNSHNRVTTTL